MRRVSHPGSDDMHAASKGAGRLSNLIDVFGPVTKPVDFNYEDFVNHETWPTTAMYAGKSIFFEAQISTMLKRTMNPFVNDLVMPMRYHKGTNISWQKWKSNRTLPSLLPTGAPAPRVTQSRSMMHTSMNRYELAFSVNTETLDDEEGQFALALDLATVATAFGDLIEQLCIVALLQGKNYHREKMRKSHQPYGDAASVFAWEKALFDGLRKDPSGRGFWMVASAVKSMDKEIIKSGVLLPEGAKELLTTGAGNTDFYLYGTGARDNVELGVDNVATMLQGRVLALTIREFTIDTDGAEVAPLTRIRTIGDHVRLDDYSAKCKPEEYRSCSRTIKAFDMSEARGVFKDMSLMYYLAHTERFLPNEEGSLDVDRHNKLARDIVSKRMAAHLPETAGDMYLYKTNDGYEVARVHGQMEERFLSDDTIRDVAKTMVQRIIEVTPSVRQALQEGQALIRQIFGAALTDEDVARLNTIVSAARAAAPLDENNVVSGNEFGAHDLDVLEDDESLPTSGGLLLKGFGSVPGLYSMSNVSPSSRLGKALGSETIGKAQRFRAAGATLFASFMDMVSPVHVLQQSQSVPVHFTSSYAAGTTARDAMHAEVAFMTHVLDVPKSPLYHLGGDGGGESSTRSRADLSAPLAASIDGASEQEHATIATLRPTIAPFATAATRAAFASAESIGDFRAKYARSKFATAYARFQGQQADDSATAAAVSKNKSFEMFAMTFLESNMQSPLAVASIMNNVVDAVASNRSFSANDIEQTLHSWAAQSPAAASSSSSAAAAAGGAAITRLVVAPSALEKAAARVRGVFALASPASIDEMIEADDRHAMSSLQSTASAASAPLFTHTLAPITSLLGPAAAAAVGNKRSYSDAMFPVSGAVGGSLRDLAEASARSRTDATIEQTELLQSRLEAARRERDPLMRVALTVFLLSPISLRTYQRMYDADVRVPVAILCERPFRKYTASTAIFFAGGDELGEIAWTKFDVMLSANAVAKTFDGMASIWVVAVVKDERRYTLAEDVLVKGYHGGESLVPFTAATFRPGSMQQTPESVFAFLVPYGSLMGDQAVPYSHDIRGFFDPELIDQRLTPAARGSVVDRPHYPSALYYNEVYRWNRLNLLSLEDSERFRVNVDGNGQESFDNSVTHQSMQWLYNHKSDEWDRAIKSTDHFGENVYEGHGDLRVMGLAQHYKDCKYQFAPI